MKQNDGPKPFPSDEISGPYLPGAILTGRQSTNGVQFGLSHDEIVETLI
jgi:hypothetical protein